MAILSGIGRVWQAERGAARWARVLSRIGERCAGQIRAWVIGWPGGFVGASSRVIGTALIDAGPQCSVGRFAWIEIVVDAERAPPRLQLGARFSASERLHIACANRVVVGVDCLLGSGVHITDHNHGIYKGADQSRPEEAPIARPVVSSGPVIIGDRVWIGDNCVIIGPARIGEGAVVGANSVVTADVPPGAIVAGAPARVIKVFDASSGEWERAPQLYSPDSLLPLVRK